MQMSMNGCQDQVQVNIEENAEIGLIQQNVEQFPNIEIEMMDLLNEDHRNQGQQAVNDELKDEV